MLQRERVAIKSSPRIGVTTTVSLALLLFCIPASAKQPTYVGDHLEFDHYEYPGDWHFMPPDVAEGTDPYFYRDFGHKTQRMSLDEVEQFGGLRW